MRVLSDQEQARREKLKLLQTAGIDPYPARIERRQSLHAVRQHAGAYERSSEQLAVAGRVRAIRLHGGSMFLDLYDGSSNLQCFVTSEDLSHDYNRLVQTLDIGDVVSAAGSLFRTKRGELTLKAVTVQIVAKSLRPLPEKWHGLADVELRYRHRELDLIANEQVKRIVELRGKVLEVVRSFFIREGFLEVETPVLQPLPGGANARPFVTHHNALNIDLYLRIAPELYLKRLTIGGIERVFEIARCFRNEGIDHHHNPEFTQVEAYAAYTDYQWMMNVTERLLVAVCTATLGTTEISWGKGTIRFSTPFTRIRFRDALKHYGNIDIEKYHDFAQLKSAAKAHAIDVSGLTHRGQILDELYTTLVRPRITDPAFITDHPIELSPLAKKKADDQRYAERFQLLAGGFELCNAFSELNDPLDQRERFEAQQSLRRAGDEEAQRIDEEFLEALEYGMPPTSGLGVGIDRLIMLLANVTSIKEVIAFPTLKPKP